jgi:hypothetical protein
MATNVVREPKDDRRGDDFADVVEKPLGPVVAAMIAGGVGSFVLGLMTTLNEASESVHGALEWSEPVGPLSGKTGVAVIAWLIAWPILHVVFRGRGTTLKTAFTITMILVALGVLGTFPTFFEAFAGE